MDKKEQAKLRKRKQRDKERDIGERDINSVTASYVQGLDGKMYQTLPERPRFVTLSDSQVLDRTYQPEPNRMGDVSMQACNESSYNYKPHQPSKETLKELEKAVKG